MEYQHHLKMQMDYQSMKSVEEREQMERELKMAEVSSLSQCNQSLMPPLSIAAPLHSIEVSIIQ